MITAALFLWLALQGVSPEAAQHMQAGVEAHKQGQFDVAIKEFRKATESDPNLAQAFLDLGEVCLETRDYPAAVAALKRALELSPELDAAHLQLGYALLAQGYAEQAIPHLDRVHALEALGIAQIETGRYEAAVANLSAALVNHPGNPDLLYYLGRASGLLSKRSIDTLMSAYPDSARAHQAMGENYFVLRQMPQAEKEYGAALQQRPDLPGLHLELGLVYSGAADWPKAEEAFRFEAKLQPGSAEAAYRLGSALLQQGKGQEARAELQRSDHLQPDMPETLYSLGKAASLEGDSALAEKSWTRLLAVEKDTALAAQTHFALAALYRKAGDAAKAKREMQEYQKLQGKILETQNPPK
ncbi:MAG: tetratricopeptide repeat protein [Candidatus Acidiferrum sp.]